MTGPAVRLTPWTPEVLAEWRDYENRNARAATAYQARPFREIRREAERHLYRAAS